MSDSSASTEPVRADSEPPPSDEASLSSKGSRDGLARFKALDIGVLIGMGFGLGLGVGLGSAARKRIDRLARY